MSVPNGSLQYGYDMDPAVAGMVGYLSPDIVIFGYKNSGRVKQVATVVVDTATNSATYTITLNGVSIAIVADGSATKIEIAAALAVAINAEEEVSGEVIAASDGVDTVTVTSRVAGRAFTISDADAKLTTTTTTANTTASDVPFGVGLVRAVSGSAQQEEECALPSGTANTAQVDTLTPTAVNSFVYIFTIIYGGKSYLITATADGSAIASEVTLALTNAVNAAMPANSVLAADTGTAITLTDEVPGTGFQVVIGSANLAHARTTASVSASLAAEFLGVSQYSHGIQNDSDITGTDSAYPADSIVDAVTRGPVWVELDSDQSALKVGDPVYLRFSATADVGTPGQFRLDGGSNKAVLIPSTKARWEKGAKVLDDGSMIALLKIY